MAVHGETTELRPGVSWPDWSVVTMPVVESALAENLATRPDKFAKPLTRSEDRVWRAVLLLCAQLGRPPRKQEIIAAVHLPSPRIGQLLRDLEKRDLLALGIGGQTLHHVYPISARRTRHRLIMGKRTLYAMCAIDAIGAGAMYELDVEINSRCGWCRKAIVITTRNRGKALHGSCPETAVVWYNLTYCDTAAGSVCPTTMFYCSDGHLERWFAMQTSPPRGKRLSLFEAHELGRAVFGSILLPCRRAIR